ncbi:hypothetical protein K2173_005662 [Erythroxylum novogranatense]|uniref:RING-type E3 ubiquitin transferase n=1 Tax=Erythroxylum novogranatense TaxID=1862640 RepID=A0AAV8SR52_9ROSI|nr:hypothetical protein K2173_005662 [Erythroxylum novogranatense]
MEEVMKPEAHMTSAAAFVEGGVQDKCDDACSICLEEFCETDPSTVTSCKHEFHLQCILEWCQRSSDCPMCLQAISLKDATSQELFEAVEQERKLRAARSRNTTIFHHPTLGEFELHLPDGASDAELEERIIQHLAAAAAMRRTHRFVRRESQRNRSSPHGRPHFMVFSTHPGSPSGHASSSMHQLVGENESAPAAIASPSAPRTSDVEELPEHTLHYPRVLADNSSLSSGSTASPTRHPALCFSSRGTSSQSSPPNQNRAGPSDFQSFSESLKTRLSAVSMRYKESISRSTRGWKERLFSRNNSMTELGSEVRREVSEGIATVSRMMERLESRDNDRANQVSISTRSNDCSVSERSNENISQTHRQTPLAEGCGSASCATTSAST